MIHSVLTSNNETTLPKAVVEALKLKPSDKIYFEIGADKRVVLTAKKETFASVAAGLSKRPKLNPVPTIEDMDTAIKDMAVKRSLRTGIRKAPPSDSSPTGLRN